jgi:hypothetical protein
MPPAIESFAASAVQARGDVGDDPLDVLLDGARDLAERGQPRTHRPADPVEQLVACDVDLGAIEDLRERLLEQVGAIQRPVGPLHVGELASFDIGEVPRILLQREACAFDGLLFVGVGVAPLLATYGVERVMGKTLHVEAVEDQPGLGRGFRDGLDVGCRQVERDRLQLRAPLLSQLFEEGAERGGVLALASPHDGAALVVDHDGDVLAVAASIADAPRIMPLQASAHASALPPNVPESQKTSPGVAGFLIHTENAGNWIAEVHALVVDRDRPCESRGDGHRRTAVERDSHDAAATAIARHRE